MITVKRFYLNDLRECCFILSDPTKECVIVDPGISNKSERDRIVRYIADSGLRPVKLLCTHGHFDHVMGNRFITETYNIPTYIHPADKDLLKLAKNTCMLFSIAIEDPDTRTTDISEGDRITFGNSWLEVISTPGHTWGSVLFYNPEEKICITGDTLFAGSCGRTDLPEGDSQAMCNSLIKKVAKLLDPETVIYPGHGPESTMAEELAANPYLKAETWMRYNIGI